MGSCAFDYFSVLLTIDHLIDSQEENINTPKILLETILLHERAIRQLCDLIDSPSVFWNHFDQLKKQYIQAVLTEKQLSVSKNNFGEDSFEELAFSKSVICCAIVHGLQALCEQQANTEALEKILKHTHIAFQYLDDISDFKKDIEGNQWTYPQVLVKQYLATNVLVADTSNVQHKYLFLSGIGQDLVQKAVSHYKQAATLAKNLGLIELEKYLQKQKEAALFYENEIGYLLEKTTQKAKKSNIFEADNTLNSSIEKGLKYLTTQAEEGFWTDFMTSAGRGKTWISGYVGWQLAQYGFEMPLLKKVLLNLSDEGAYNDQLLQDADSTTFLVGFHQALNGTVPAQLIENWLKFQNPNGSRATYRDEAALRKTLDLDTEISVEGWLSGHDCVSAAAALGLASIPEMNAHYEKTISHLVAQIQHDGIRSYWWTSNIYAQTFVLLALCKRTGNLKPKNQLVETIVNQQHSDGFWTNPTDNAPSAFYTALALKAMLTYEPKSQEFAIEAAAKWLQNHQTTDGSWQTSRILRIPATDVINPATVKVWRNSSFGVNALSDDYNRVFTTATVVNCLNLYSEMFRK